MCLILLVGFCVFNITITKLWRTIKGIDGRAKRTAENEAISNGISFSSSTQLDAKFNKQFNTSKLGRHSSSKETRLVTSQEETNGDGGDFHRGHSYESNREL